ncbi:MAG: hypothetical protein JW860_11250 [Sedimentisphaerales bacterium]|nr:hypothetical protein [Sedimentisphaerales bacterium]
MGKTILILVVLFLAIIHYGCVNVQVKEPLVDMDDEYTSSSADDSSDGSASPAGADDKDRQIQVLKRQLADCRNDLQKKERKIDELENRLDQCEDKVDDLEDKIEDMKD